MMSSQSLSIAAGCVLALLWVGCGDDDDEANDAGNAAGNVADAAMDAGTGKRACNVSLDEWCKKGHCDGWRTFDDRIADPPPLLIVAECGDRKQLSVTDGYISTRYVYDATGRLIGVGTRDDVTDEDCPDGYSGGNTSAEDCTWCELVTSTVVGSTYDACTGPIAEPRIQMCMAHPPAMVQHCAECACTHCYPKLVDCDEQDPDNQLCDWLARQCVAEKCMDCRLSIDAPEDGGI